MRCFIHAAFPTLFAKYAAPPLAFLKTSTRMRNTERLLGIYLQTAIPDCPKKKAVKTCPSEARKQQRSAYHPKEGWCEIGRARRRMAAPDNSAMAISHQP